LSLACEGKRGYRVSDPDDIGTVRLVGWLMMVSCPNSTYSFFCSCLVAGLCASLVRFRFLKPPITIFAVRDRQWILFGVGLFEGQGKGMGRREG